VADGAAKTPDQKGGPVHLLSIGADSNVVAGLLAAILLGKAVLHSDPDTITAALHCDEARSSMAYAVLLLDHAGLLRDDGPLEEIYERIGRRGTEFLRTQHPEWFDEGDNGPPPLHGFGSEPLGKEIN